MSHVELKLMTLGMTCTLLTEPARGPLARHFLTKINYLGKFLSPISLSIKHEQY